MAVVRGRMCLLFSSVGNWTMVVIRRRLAAYYSSLKEQLFLENLEEDLDIFLSTADNTQVIVLPPLNPRFRFLTHNLVQNAYPSLKSVSIGSGKQRRTVIFPKAQALDVDRGKAMSTEESVGIQAKKNLSVGRGRGKTSNQQTATSQSKNNTSESKSESWSKTVVENSLPKRVSKGRGWRRPDQALYVPRALRKENNKENADRQSSKDSREEDKTHKNNRDILSDSDDNGQTCADRQLSARLHPEEENSAVSIASEDEVQEFPGVSNNEKGTEELVNKLSKLNMSCEQYKSLDVRKELVDISDIKEDSCFKKNVTGNEKVDSEQIKEPIDPQGGKELPVSVLTEVLEMKNSMTSENDTCVKSLPLAESIEEKQYSFRNQDKMGMDKSADSVKQIKVNDACLSIADNSVQGNKQQNLIKNTLRENIDSFEQTQMTDTCQSKSLVTSCVESDNEQEGQNLLHQDVKESVSLDHQYQQPLIDTCQSSSTDGVDKYDDDTQHKELRSIEYQDLKENSLTSDKDLEATNILEPKDGTSKLLENTSIVDENLGKENRQLPLLENQGVMGTHLGNISQETRFTETCQLSKCYTKVNSELHDESGHCSGDITSMTSSRGDDALEVESCHSSKCFIEINSELHDASGCCSGDITSTTSSREYEPLEVESKADEEAYNEGHLIKESSSNFVLDNISKEVEDNSSCATLRDNAELIHEREKTDNCCKSDVVSTEKTCTGDKANFEAKDSIVKNEIVNKIPDENKEAQEKITETERGTSKEYRTLETINCTCNENKMNPDNLVNNEKTPETEAKQKKKSKKKKDGEAEARDEKKKKKRKKKESEGDREESKEKDKEKDEKNSKLKKKSKKKATKEDSESKSEDSRSKEKLKDKKEKKCKNGSEDDADDDDDESWESKFNEDGDCLEPELLNELTEVTGIKKPSKHKTQFHYYTLPSKEVTLDDDDDSGYGHIAELYDFSPELKTQDLVQLLSSFKSQGYDIKWVDNTHALAVFSSEIAAKQAIQTCSSPIMKLRPVSQGTLESKSKAKRYCSFLQPYKPRPKTTNLAAHRLVTGALGVRSTMSKEDREREREKIKEAKEQKRQEKQRKAEIWGE